jgi:putative ABC transport system permease protein
MPTNYLKITARRLLRQKAFTLINILGLSMGLAACLIIYLYVYSEMTFDAYNPFAGRIARVTSIIHSPESDLALAASPQPLGGALQCDYPEVEAVARLDDSSFAIRQGADVFAAENFYFSEPSIFRNLPLSVPGRFGGTCPDPAEFYRAEPKHGKEIFR